MSKYSLDSLIDSMGTLSWLSADGRPPILHRIVRFFASQLSQAYYVWFRVRDSTNAAFHFFPRDVEKRMTHLALVAIINKAKRRMIADILCVGMWLEF